MNLDARREILVGLWKRILEILGIAIRPII